MKTSRPARARRIKSYKFASAQRFKRAGSDCARFAFCAKPVFGRLTVFFKSSGASVDIKVPAFPSTCGHRLRTTGARREFVIVAQPNGNSKLVSSKQKLVSSER